MIERINSPLSSPVSLSDYQAQNALTAALMLGMQMPVGISGGNVLLGSLFYVGGALYKATSNTAITGASSDYVKLTPSADGSELSASYVASLSGVTWNSVYKGYYDVDGNGYVFDEFNLTLNNTLSYENKINERQSASIHDFIGNTFVRNFYRLGMEYDVGGGVVGSFPCLTNLSETRVALVSQFGDLYVYDFDGILWSLTAVPYTIVGSGVTQIAGLSENRIALIDSSLNVLRTYDFNGITWGQVGNSLAVANLAARVVGLTETQIGLLIYNGVTYTLQTYSFDGTDWSTVGNQLVTGIAINHMAKLTSTTIALLDADNDELKKYSFDGTNWSLSGTGIAIEDAFTTVAGISEDVCVIEESTSGILKAYLFYNNTWNKYDTEYDLGVSDYPALTQVNGNSFAFIDSTEHILRMFTLARNVIRAV